MILAIREEEGCSGVATHDNSLSMPGWFEARLGTDDVLVAFRQLPVFPEHRPLNTVLWFDTRAKACRFATVGWFLVDVGCQCFLQWHWNDAQVPSWAWRMLMDSITMEVVLGEFSARKFFGWSLKSARSRLC